jgi:uncharacterized membrane protein YvbJ
MECRVDTCPNCGYHVCCGDILPPECPLCGSETNSDQKHADQDIEANKDRRTTGL